MKWMKYQNIVPNFKISENIFVSGIKHDGGSENTEITFNMLRVVSPAVKHAANQSACAEPMINLLESIYGKLERIFSKNSDRSESNWDSILLEPSWAIADESFEMTKQIASK